MKRLSQTLKIGLAVFMSVFTSGLTQLYTAPSAAAAKQQIIACHATSSASNPFEAIKPDQTSNHIDPTTGLGLDNHPNDFLILTDIEVTQNNWGSVQKQLDAECAAENPANPLVAAAVTFNDLCETAGDTYTIPTASEYIEYYVNGVLQTAGTYSATDTVSVEAKALYGRTLSGTTTWSHTFTNEPCEAEEEPVYYVQTSHQTICGQVTVSLRNVSPWMYRVLIEEKIDGNWVRVGATAGDPKWQVGLGVMEVNNFDEAPNDQTGTYVVKYAEDAGNGTREIRYKVSSGTEKDLYVGLPVSEFTTVTVNTDCQPPVEVDLCLNIDGIQTMVPQNLVRGEDGNCYKKVFICKFVGEPTVNERFQGILSVSVNSIIPGQWDGIIPGWFSDAHDRSFVLGYDDGTFEPSEADCFAAASEATYRQNLCVIGSNTTDTYTVTVKNTVDLFGQEVTYTVTLTPLVGAAIQKTVVVADGEEATVPFTNLPSGKYTVQVTATDGTEFDPEIITIGHCTSNPGSGGGGHIDGEAASTTVPATIPATGAINSGNPFLILTASLVAYGATFFLQKRRDLNADRS